MRRLAIALVVACGGSRPATVEIPLPQSGPQTAYAIHLNRPSRVGDRAHLVVTGEEDRVTTTRRAGAVVSDEHEKKRARIDAVLTVLSLDEKDEGADVAYDVTDLTYARAGREVVHLRGGHVMVERKPKEDDAIVNIDGQPATEDLRDAMKLVMSLRRGGPSDDDVFGTKIPQRVGSHWHIDEKRALDDLVAQEGPEMASASTSGDAWLEGVTRVGEDDCLDVHARLRIDNLDFSEKVPSSTADVARVIATFSAAFPLDAAKPRVTERMLIEMTVKLRTPSPSGEITVELEGVQRREGTYQPMSR